jgi:hypothetical protein
MSQLKTPDGSQPWPLHLEYYVPDQWDCKASWHAARSSVAHLLGRRCLPEIRAMVGLGDLANYVGGQGL